MNLFFLPLVLFHISILSVDCSVHRHGDEYVDGVVVYRTNSRRKNDFSTDCWTFFGLSLQWCAWVTTPASYWNTYFRPMEAIKNMSYTELVAHCEDEFVCDENTGCYKDYVRYFNLDSCHDATFRFGPMKACIATLVKVMEESPESLSECVRDHLEKTEINPSRDPYKPQPGILRNCQDIAEYRRCYLPAVEKYCDAQLAIDFKKHMEIRLYNRACDGRLRYKDWDYTADHHDSVQVVPHGPVVPNYSGADGEYVTRNSTESESTVNV